MRTVLISGASGNMGKALIKKFLQEGDQVIGTIGTFESSWNEIVHPNFEKVVVDLTNEKDTNNFFYRLLIKYGHVHIAILTVGGFSKGSIIETNLSDIEKQIQLNFYTAYNLARPVFNQMMTQHEGQLFLTGSVPGKNSVLGKGLTAYTLAKSLIFRLAELMNEEAKGKNVKASVVVPTTIDTPQNRLSMPDADFTKWMTPEKIANDIFEESTVKV